MNYRKLFLKFEYKPFTGDIQGNIQQSPNNKYTMSSAVMSSLATSPPVMISPVIPSPGVESPVYKRFQL